MAQHKKRYMVPVDEKTVETAKRITEYIRKNGIPVTYTGVLVQALKDGIAEAAKKFEIPT